MSVVGGTGNDKALELLNLLSQPEVLKQRLASYQTKIKEAEEKIALAGKASDIEVLHEQAESDRALAAKTMEDAKAAVMALTKKVKVETDNLILEAQDRAYKLVYDAGLVEAASIAKVKEQRAILNELVVQSREAKEETDIIRAEARALVVAAENKMKEARKARDEALALKAAFERKMAALKSLASEGVI